MFAVIQTGGKQYTVNVDDVLKVEKLENAIGEKIIFDALFTDDNGEIKTGAEASNVKVTAEVLSHGKADKIIVSMLPILQLSRFYDVDNYSA